MTSNEQEHSRQLEEQLAFQEREVEHCRAQILELWEALTAAQQRIGRVEQILGSSAEESDVADLGSDEPE